MQKCPSPKLRIYIVHFLLPKTNEKKKKTCDSYLEYDSTLKYNEHEQREERVVPILVQTPQTDTENLKDEERGHSMFLE